MDSESDPNCSKNWIQVQIRTRDKVKAESKPETESVKLLKSKIQPNLWKKINPNPHGLGRIQFRVGLIRTRWPLVFSSIAGTV